MRLVTRGDLDGLTCAVLLTSCEDIDEIVLVHPQDITDKKVRGQHDRHVVAVGAQLVQIPVTTHQSL